MKLHALIPTVLIKESGFLDKAKPGEDNYGFKEFLAGRLAPDLGSRAIKATIPELKSTTHNPNPRGLTSQIGTKLHTIRYRHNIGAALSNLVAATTENKDVADVASVIGTGFGSVPFGSELFDSLVNYENHRASGLSKLKSLRSFKSMPLASALLLHPAIMNKWKEHKGGYTSGDII